jgi:D-alanyl-D-alanine carboxypeptidase
VCATVTGWLCLVALPPWAGGGAGASTPGGGSTGALSEAIDHLMAAPGGPVGVIAVVDRKGRMTVDSQGTSELGMSTPITLQDHMRLASVSKAFSGAVALALVSQGTLHLTDTVGQWLPTLPGPWHKVTLAELLQHTSGIQDFSQTDAFKTAITADPQVAPPPATLLGYAQPELEFTPGSTYEYSNSDNIVVALMVEAATGQSYQEELASQVTQPLGLTGTSLPSDSAMPTPFVTGYQPDPPGQPEDVTGPFAAGWSFSSGGVVSTPLDATTFVRAYARGAGISAATHATQMRFRPGSSEPPGPGVNSAGLAIFRYQTRCGTVYGHTGNTPGYTQFVAATANGSKSVTVSINAQISPKTNAVAFADLSNVELLGVCAALAR